MTWKIGNLFLEKRTVLAPMAGYTDWVYRKLVREQGGELAYFEMLSSEAYVRNARKSFELLRTTPKDRPTGVQIMGSRPEVLAETAKRIEAGGFCLIDINIGCPAKKIVRQGAGSAILKNEKLFSDIVRSVTRAVTVPVTLKLRIGFEAKDEDHFIRLLKIAESEGVSAITVHGRTQKQLFKGLADPLPIKIAKETVRCPIIGNGDVTTGEKAQELRRLSGCDAVMIGRGSMGNPWIFREANAALQGDAPPPEPTLVERLTMLARHGQEMMDWYGEKLGLLRMRKITPCYLNYLAQASAFRKKAVTLKTKKEFEEFISDLRSHLNC